MAHTIDARTPEHSPAAMAADPAQLFTGAGSSAAFGSVPKTETGQPEQARSYATGERVVPPAASTATAPTANPADAMLGESLKKHDPMSIAVPRRDAAVRASDIVRSVIWDLYGFNVQIGTDAVPDAAPNFVMSLVTQCAAPAISTKAGFELRDTEFVLKRTAACVFDFSKELDGSPVVVVTAEFFAPTKEAVRPGREAMPARGIPSDTRLFGPIDMPTHLAASRRRTIQLFLQDMVEVFGRGSSLSSLKPLVLPRTPAAGQPAGPA